MTKPPVLKPREVAAILEKLGFEKSDSAGRTNNIDTLMACAQRFHSTPEGIFLLSCLGK